MRPERHPCGTYVAGVVIERAACGCCYDVPGRVSSLALTRAGFMQRPCLVTGAYRFDRAAVKRAIENGWTAE